MASFLTRQYRNAKSWSSRNAGEIARGALVGGTGAVVGVWCPPCGVAAAVAVDETLGPIVERNVRRGTEATTEAIQRYLDDPEGPAPSGMITELEGAALSVRSLGSGDRFEPVSQAAVDKRVSKAKWTKRAPVLAVAAGLTALGIYRATTGRQ